MKETAPTVAGTGNIIEVALGEGSLNVFTRGIQLTGLVETLAGAGPFTVFAPTDNAFDDFAGGDIVRLLRNTREMRDIVLYHVVPGLFSGTYFNDHVTLKTMLGKALTIDRSKFISPDIRCSNGIIHIIDAVLS